MTEQDDIAAASEKTKNALHDVELMINSLNDVRLSVHHVFHILQGRSPPVSGSAFRENAKFTYTALESLAKLAISSEGSGRTWDCGSTGLTPPPSEDAWLLNDAQSTELPKLQGPSPISLETKQKEAQQDENAMPTNPLPGVATTTFESEMAPEYANLCSLSVDDTLRWFERKARKSGSKVRATRLETQQSFTFSTLKNAVWEDSSHLVFKKISQIAVGAVDYFMDKAPRSLLGLVLEWISMYTTLFTASCTGCGKHLYFDSQQFKHLPPTLYTFDDKGMALPFHPACQKK
ncbi:hypothetical protein BGX24_001764 [Mortierella sp. AD032]|nr:hypothetical protein BGX24_001764 [Mortierella sp. AD032]